ncbi:MAG: enoyl-CoA hydratase/isomerase family protein [Micavibrio aeruginosavorus]|uniref:3-hydroxyisobutyryl-CoA hydrolase n=1 Tax=Micavibrio aeruginosavorus TaxID=349221 RepID=A0A7T5R0D2_9BACT|nr:MAG: enoyl-CoA hydratase/isomerase family protein [Micavibrio aeruginosavorus]
MSTNTENEILACQQGSILTVTLNRPAALNALSEDMIVQMRQGLDRWAVDPSVALVVFRGAGGKAFCAGGDIKSTWAHRADLTCNDRYFYNEYNLIRALYYFPKPTIALMDGITMGGGYGVAGACRFRVATENTKWAMPETGIGFFPDVAAAYYLLRAPGSIGMCLALTGMTIGPEDALYGGFASHYVYAAALDDMMQALHDGADGVAALARFHKAPMITGPLCQHQDLIDECFSEDTPQAVLSALSRQPSEWAQTMAALLRSRSPLSIGVAFERMKRARGRSFDQIIEDDYVIARRFMRGNEFFEGVRAVLVDKDKSPKWQPETLENLTETDVLPLFETLPGNLANGFKG